jgi:S1/P1 nuclease
VRKILGPDETLEQASVWADCAKGVVHEGARFRYAPKDRFPECARFETRRGKAAMVRFVARNAARCAPGQGDEACGHRTYHYADVATQHDRYDRHWVGTSDHDVVAAVHAAVAVLQGRTAPAPFVIDSKRDALRLLAHWVGDLHQPLHVEAVYLDARGRAVDPDRGAFDPATTTRGGNSIQDGDRNLHAEWDAVRLEVADGVRGDLAAARAVPPAAGSPAGWPEAWATDTIVAGRAAFAPLAFGRRDGDHWTVTPPADYARMREDLQRRQLTKAGARLAQLVRAIWP